MPWVTLLVNLCSFLNAGFSFCRRFLRFSAISFNKPTFGLWPFFVFVLATSGCIVELTPQQQRAHITSINLYNKVSPSRRNKFSTMLLLHSHILCPSIIFKKGALVNSRKPIEFNIAAKASGAADCIIIGSWWRRWVNLLRTTFRATG